LSSQFSAVQPSLRHLACLKARQFFLLLWSVAQKFSAPPVPPFFFPAISHSNDFFSLMHFLCLGFFHMSSAFMNFLPPLNLEANCLPGPPFLLLGLPSLHHPTPPPCKVMFIRFFKSGIFFSFDDNPWRISPSEVLCFLVSPGWCCFHMRDFFSFFFSPPLFPIPHNSKNLTSMLAFPLVPPPSPAYVTYCLSVFLPGSTISSCHFVSL